MNEKDMSIAEEERSAFYAVYKELKTSQEHDFFFDAKRAFDYGCAHKDRQHQKEMDEAMNLLKHIHGYLYLNWADNGTLKDRIEAFLAKHKERING